MKRSTPYKRSRRNVLIVICSVAVVVSIGLIWWFYPTSELEQELEIPVGDLSVEKQSTTPAVESENATDDSYTVQPVVIDGDESVAQEIVDKATAYLNNMNDEAKAAQLLWVTPEELTDYTLTVQAGETTKNRLTTYPVSGIVYTNQNFEVPDQMELMLNNTKLYTRYPIFLAMDEEGLEPLNNLKMESTGLGFNVEIIEDTFYLVNGDARENIGNSLNIVYCSNEEDAVGYINDGADILFVESGFEDIYNELLDAIRDGTLSYDVVDERILKTLIYKIQKSI